MGEQPLDEPLKVGDVIGQAGAAERVEHAQAERRLVPMKRRAFPDVAGAGSDRAGPRARDPFLRRLTQRLLGWSPKRAAMNGPGRVGAPELRRRERPAR